MKKVLLTILLSSIFRVNAQTSNPLHKEKEEVFNAILVDPSQPIIINHKINGSLTKKLVLNVNNPGLYAGLSVFADNELIMDDFNIPKKGDQTISGIVSFRKKGSVEIRLQSFDETLTINSFHFEDIIGFKLPSFQDISVKAGLDKVSSLKYGGPSVADLNNDGYYDFIVNNHNQETSKLYWNNGDGTVTKHDKNLSRWFKHDLHGTALGDYDNDGDLDLVLTQGGSYGENPSKVNLYHNNKNKLILFTGDVEIDRGGRGRGARWIDMDLDGDLDLLLVNESSLKYDKPQHFFYENNGDGTFVYKSVKEIQDVEESRVLVTDFNNDNIDDLIFYSPLTLWKGNGDFTYTDVTELIPDHIRSLNRVMAITDIDIDNDGDLDLYLARGLVFERGVGETPSLDFNPITSELSIKTRGYKGSDAFDFTLDGNIRLHKYYYLAQGSLVGKTYPIFFGKNKIEKNVDSGEELEVTLEMAQGWPDDISEKGFYLGHIGNSQWKAILVRDDNIFWQYRFSLSGVTSVTPDFIPQNRNNADVLLRNDGDKFTDVSKAWNIPKGGNALGVTTGDFNNDSHQDLFVYRWGRVGARISDYMLLNTGNNSFETTTMHGANDVGGPGNGDMGQAFDFDLDGQLDLLNGSENGEWYLYKNETNSENNYVALRVGYSPKSNVDPISAEVIVKTANNEYRKRVGSAGEIFSQSLMNIVHFGLGHESEIKSIKVRWRNGETVEFKNKEANKIYNTDNVNNGSNKDLPVASISFKTKDITLYTSENLTLDVAILPKHKMNADLIWTSNNSNVLTVDKNGNVTPIAPGRVVVKAASKDNSVSSEIKVTVAPYTAPYVKILNKEQYENNQVKVGDNLKVTVKYHAGSGNRVISADEGGIRFWLRHFKSKWIPVKDVVLVNKDALKTTSGTANMTFSLKDYMPSNQLQENHFYQLRVTFTSSDGNMYEDEILPLIIISR
ncbi:FG-GAP-like repeat-containing protein [Gelidibacter salicanalis]|uniref:VCBS repeat-containing protein n=1 Tax=Gelidibacter salicanalis TaxID=291193 RepID=A0A934NHR8_9FLAO|nr:FG-GAP-like repeat-containing protein [Gelidibacter salicanalis]MBJ7880138.1 VCBS repeat-containing protein [Gelidibacter salicanalis]